MSADENENFETLSAEIFDNDELESLNASDKKLGGVLKAYFDSNIYPEFVFISGQNRKDGSSRCLLELRRFKFAVSLCARLGNAAALSNSVFPEKIRGRLAPCLSYIEKVANDPGFLKTDKMSEFEAVLNECIAAMDDARTIEARLVKERERAEFTARREAEDRERGEAERLEKNRHSGAGNVAGRLGELSDNEDDSFTVIEKDRISWEARQKPGDDGTGCGLSIIGFFMGGFFGGPVAAVVGALLGYLIGYLGQGGGKVVRKGKFEKTREYKLNRDDGEFAEEEKEARHEEVSEKKEAAERKRRREREPADVQQPESDANAGCLFSLIGFCIGALLNGYTCAFGGAIIGFFTGELSADIKSQKPLMNIIGGIRKTVMAWGVFGGIYLGYGFMNSLAISIIAVVLAQKIVENIYGRERAGLVEPVKSGSERSSDENERHDDDTGTAYSERYIRDAFDEKGLKNSGYKESDFSKTADFFSVVASAGGFIYGAIIYGDKYGLSVSGAMIGGLAAVLFSSFITSILRSYLFPRKNKK